jgi:hypothetical protein
LYFRHLAEQEVIAASKGDTPIERMVEDLNSYVGDYVDDDETDEDEDVPQVPPELKLSSKLSSSRLSSSSLTQHIPPTPAPVADFVSIHGAHSKESIAVQEYPWSVLDHTTRFSNAAAMDDWPLGPPKVIRPLWADCGLSRETLRKACLNAAATSGHAVQGSIVGRGTAGESYFLT